ncbi:putative short-chain dehydrogenase [Podospora appendiculata]|uniref:Short-chain dehydrogenase n=1 Tax=Podospora appendiculata TaxID=314037 RepID=A0AAE0XAY7_9PEZI|nr:putative short-chain dehydrogenase [Podospora appendiculata]
MAPYNARTTSEEVVRDLADQIKGKVILTTGVSPASIGATFVKSIAAAKPSLLILAGRNAAKIQETADAITAANPDIKVRLLELDLGSLAEVRKSAALVNSWDDVPVIDALANNSGIMATEFALTVDGFERQFGTNHLAHFLFTNLVMSKILASKAPRVVSVSSDAYMLSPIRFDDVDFKKGETYNKWQAYGQSKTGNTSSQGAATHVFAAFADEALRKHNGAYLVDAHVPDPNDKTVFQPWATSVHDSEKLWKLSEKLVGQKFAY